MAEFTLNRAGVDAFIRSNGLERYVDGIVNQVHDRTKQNAHGKFRKLLGKTPARRDGDDTVVGTVYTDDWFAHLYEFGSIKNRPYAPMTRAARSLGFEIDRP